MTQHALDRLAERLPGCDPTEVLNIILGQYYNDALPYVGDHVVEGDGGLFEFQYRDGRTIFPIISDEHNVITILEEGYTFQTPTGQIELKAGVGKVSADKDHITYHKDMLQGTDEWHQVRLGILTASEVKHILTPTLKTANNEKTRAHVYTIASQRITQTIDDPGYLSDDMIRGMEEEELATIRYSKEIAPVDRVGFITNNKWGFTIGYSPDGLVGDDGLTECKSRLPKYQVQTIVNHVVNDQNKSIPDEYMMQCQTGLLVTERKWLDFISYCGGLPMAVIRVYPDPKYQAAIVEAATRFEEQVSKVVRDFNAAAYSAPNLYPTDRIEREGMMMT